MLAWVILECARVQNSGIYRNEYTNYEYKFAIKLGWKNFAYKIIYLLTFLQIQSENLQISV